METIEINGEKYEKVSQTGMKKMIIVLDNRGLTFVGDCDLSKVDENGLCTIKNAQCIIYWGTTGHLAEIAKNGKTTKTRLGESYDISFNPKNLIIKYDCEVSKW